MKKISVCIILSILALSGCTDSPSSDQIQNRQQETLNKQAVQAVGLPSIVNFQEKRNLKMILELRDSAKLATITYTQDMNGVLHRLCRSIGYGIPYATQYTNPNLDIYQSTSSGVHMAMPQADPNGLYSPSSAEGTWILCVSTKTKEMSPVYVEPRVIVSQFELDSEE